jgi:hypothetical protein
MAQREYQIDESIDPAEASSPVEIWGQYPELESSKLFHEFASRLVCGRDMHVIITASAETGVGKTTLAFVIALLWDMHGWTVNKATLDPREYDILYDKIRPGSVLMLDEVEQAADSRRGSSRENVNLSQAFATKRYRQVFGVMTAPSKSWVDNRIGSDSADYWIKAEETPDGRPKGEATVYRLKNNEHYEESYSERKETISWPVMDHHPEFRKLEEKKVSRMEGSTQSKYVHRNEVEEIKENFWNKAWKKARYELICNLADDGVQQQVIANAADLSPARISQLVNTDSFEEAYST